MGRSSHLTTEELDGLTRLINRHHRLILRLFPGDPAFRERMDAVRAGWIRRLHRHYKPSARPWAGPEAVRILQEMVEEWMGRVEPELVRARRRCWELACANEELRAWLAGARAEAEELREEVERLREELACRPSATRVTIPERTVVVRSRLQGEVLRLMGAEGLGRSWRIRERVVEAGLVGNPNSVRNGLRKLTRRGLIDDYRRDGEPVRWSPTAGGGRRLLVLTEVGRAWYREAFGEEPVESELVTAARRHRSVVHGVGVLEARDHLRAAGYEVDEEPGVILARAEERWGARVEPDLVVVMEGEVWPVEVQREVSERVLGKWARTLRLVGRLVLVLFNEQGRVKQERLLREA